MSELTKRIGKTARREASGGFGFGSAKREQPRAMLAAVLVKDTASAKAAIEAGADVVILDGHDAAGAAAAIKPLSKVCAGAKLAVLDEAGAKALRAAGCDFVISPLDKTTSAAVDTEEMGQVIVASDDHTDTMLRALPPLSLDALYVDGANEATTLDKQLELVRLSSFSSSPLMVTVKADATASELRVLRDSGSAVAVLALGTSAANVSKLVETLKSVPAPKRAKSEGGAIALVPSMAKHDEDEEEGEDPE
ncbi:MAG: hypothetical protein ACKVT1_16615 [Dehalococcoidia bacterium]